MLGKFVRDQSDLPSISVGSKKLTAAILENWKEEAWATDITLDKKDPIWEEWWMGASAIDKICPRMFALMAAAGLRGFKRELFNAETMWLFGLGKAYHKLFQQEILMSFPPGVLLGRWRRRSRKTQVILEVTHFKNEVPEGMSLERGWGPRPAKDDNEKEETFWEFDEPKIRIPDHRVVVKMDGILNWPDEEELEVLELKTEKTSAKDDLNPNIGGRPRDKHIEQANVAMWATGLKRARIVYIFKGEVALATSIIEHVIERDDKLIEDIKKRTTTCVDAVREMDTFRDEKILEVSRDHFGPHENVEVLPLGDLVPEIEDEVRLLMKKKAEEMPKLKECKWKSKGKPKYCAGRDLCFGVRKKKKKK